MYAYFYKMTAEKDVLNKEDSLTQLLEVTGILLKDGSDIMNPVLRLKTDKAEIFASNYCYIPQFGRYYFIENISTETNGIWDITLKVDPLFSFSDQIKECSVLISRGPVAPNMYVDNECPITAGRTFSNKLLFSNGDSVFSNTMSYVLCVAGGD